MEQDTLGGGSFSCYVYVRSNKIHILADVLEHVNISLNRFIQRPHSLGLKKYCPCKRNHCDC